MRFDRIPQCRVGAFSFGLPFEVEIQCKYKFLEAKSAVSATDACVPVSVLFCKQYLFHVPSGGQNLVGIFSICLLIIVSDDKL